MDGWAVWMGTSCALTVVTMCGLEVISVRWGRLRNTGGLDALSEPKAHAAGRAAVQAALGVPGVS